MSTLDTPAVHPVVFDTLDASVIHAAALLIVEGAGPPGIDARAWQKLCSSYIYAASDELCGAIALFSRCLCTTFLSLYILSLFLACWLITLDKLQEFSQLGFVRWYDILWQRQPSILFGMIFKLLQDPINFVQDRLLG